jgi:hypothetical protein
MSRISDLLGKDISRLSKLVGENIKMNATVNLGTLDREGPRLRTRQDWVAKGLGGTMIHEQRE